MGLDLFVRKDSELHELLPKHNFDKDLFTDGCDFCKLGKEQYRYSRPETLDKNSKYNKFTRESCKKVERKNLCHFTFFGMSGATISSFAHHINRSLEKDYSPEETKELLNELLKIPKKKLEEIVGEDRDRLFIFNYFVKWLKLLVKYKGGFAASY